MRGMLIESVFHRTQPRIRPCKKELKKLMKERKWVIAKRNAVRSTVLRELKSLLLKSNTKPRNTSSSIKTINATTKMRFPREISASIGVSEKLGILVKPDRR